MLRSEKSRCSAGMLPVSKAVDLAAATGKTGALVTAAGASGWVAPAAGASGAGIVTPACSISN